MEPVTALVFVGGWGKTELERAMRGAHQAAARDLLGILMETGCVARAVVATDDVSFGETLSELPVHVDIDPPGRTFHFGRRLAQLVETYDVRRALYCGGGSAPLMGFDRWASTLAWLRDAERVVVTNNVHSCDWVGFTDVRRVLPVIADQTSDNGLAWVLAHEAGLAVESALPTAATRFDLDTPVDLLVARRHPGVGRHLAAFLSGLAWNGDRVDGVLATMATEGSSLTIAGRVSSAAWAAVEQTTSCWVRVFAEERGMRASGRQQRGQVRSLLADFLSLVGPQHFFNTLADLSEAVLLDNRVILAARQLWPATVDRYHSDLLRWKRIEEPFLRELAQAAAAAPVPVLMGGHSIVAGGLMALAEICAAARGGA
jgi:hypothetical protein